MRLSIPYHSADGRALYANDETGARRRVKYDGPNLVVHQRPGKAAKKRAKRLVRRSR